MTEPTSTSQHDQRDDLDPDDGGEATDTHTADDQAADASATVAAPPAFPAHPAPAAAPPVGQPSGQPGPEPAALPEEQPTRQGRTTNSADGPSTEPSSDAEQVPSESATGQASDPDTDAAENALEKGAQCVVADPVETPADHDDHDLAILRRQVTDLTDAVTAQSEQLAALGALEQLHSQVAEIARLRSRDLGIIDKLHNDNSQLRRGELAAATAPLITGLLRLHDQMVSLSSGDPQSVAGMLRTQLVQLLDTTAGVTAFEPAPGEKFDTTRHSGAGRAMTTNPGADDTIARTVRTGFARADGSIVRVAEVEVYRLQSAAQLTQPSTATPVPTGTASTNTTEEHA